MVFSSSVFLCAFLPVVLFLYFVIPNLVWRNGLLFVASLIFYAWGEPRNLPLLLGSILINYLLALGIDALRRSGKGGQKALLVAAVAVNLAILFVYKYLNFAVDNINALLKLLGVASALPRAALSLPIGISFFTFQAMSYVIDVYRDTVPVQKNPLRFGLYVALFPQLIAGPIVRYHTVAQEIGRRSVTIDDFSAGARRCIRGLGKKILLANTVAVLADYAFDTIAQAPLGFIGAWYGAVCYCLQLYFDFSGYSDIAIGLGRMFGFHFQENFNYPYAASTLTDYWRRWHISLSSWFRDYVYIPLGGSRVSRGRLLLNLFVVWLLTGIWHGANWTYICWAMPYFVLLTAEKFTGLERYLKKNRALALLYRLFTIVTVLACTVIFRSDNIRMAGHYLACMIAPRSAYAAVGLRYFTKRYVCVVAFAAFLSLPIARNLWQKAKPHLPKPVAAVTEDLFFLAVLLVSLANVVSSTYNPFIYFNF